MINYYLVYGVRIIMGHVCITFLDTAFPIPCSSSILQSKFALRFKLAGQDRER